MRTWMRAGVLVAGLSLLLGLGWLHEARADEELGKAAFAFDQAIQSYLKGDSQSAIQHLDESLKLEPANPKAKVFLLKILVERGSRLFLAKQYKKAYDYLSRAYHMDTSNEQVRQMFELAAKQVVPQKPITKVMLIPQEMQAEVLKHEAEQSARAQGAPELAQNVKKAPESKPAGPVYAEPAPMDAAPAAAVSAPAPTSFVQEYAKNSTAMMNLLANFQQRQEQQLAQFTVPLERIQRLYYQSEEDRKTFINQLDSRFKSVLGDISFQQRLVIYGFTIALFLLGLVVWGFLIVISRMRSRREETIMKYQQEMLKMVRDMAALPSRGQAYRLPGASPGMPQLMATPMAIGNAPGIGYTGGSVSPVSPDPISELEEITRTGNYKERALAAVQMLDLDAERAVEIIKRMVLDPDPFQRECIVFTLGEQYHPLVLELLCGSVKDSEKRVATAAVRALKKWEQLAAEVVGEDVRKQIRDVLKSCEGAK